MTGTSLPRQAIHRLVGALIDAERARLGRPASDDGARGLDSLERLGVMAVLGETFDLDDSAPVPEDAEGVEDWAAWVAAQRPARLVVRTSGSTGRPRSCGHDVADLLDEAAFFAAALTECRRVVTLVPAHHLYGLLWTVLMPETLGVPVIGGAPGAMPPPRPGDLIVAVPEQWAALARLRRAWPPETVGVSSAGRLDDAVAGEAMARGLSRMLEVYGASEIGGIGVREIPEEGFALLPRWRLASDGEGIIARDGEVKPLPDRVMQLPDGRIAPAGRCDDAVKIGGRNVHPSCVADRLRKVAGIAAVSVRLGANGRLKVFAVPHDMRRVDEIEAALREAARDLDPPERPTAFRFGDALPTNAMGKVMDWE